MCCGVASAHGGRVTGQGLDVLRYPHRDGLRGGLLLAWPSDDDAAGVAAVAQLEGELVALSEAEGAHDGGSGLLEWVRLELLAEALVDGDKALLQATVGRQRGGAIAEIAIELLG